MRQTASRILLTIFLSSVSIIPVIEFGHDFLHSFENPFHYHTVRHKSPFGHSSADHHHFRTMKFAHEMYAPDALNNYVWFAYWFFSPVQEFRCTGKNERGGKLETLWIGNRYQVTLLPQVPPPQFMRG